jgi:pimeloyl-ACP methyl ester carboxylesterase
MPTINLHGADIAYDEAGSGHPLLLVHAGIADRHMWDPVWDAFAARFRVIRPDLRGFGESPVAMEPFTNWHDLARLLREVDAVPAHVIGVSLGGSASLDLALAEPYKVERLVLCAPGIASWQWGDQLRADWDAEEAAWQRGDLDEVTWANVRTWVDPPSTSRRRRAPSTPNRSSRVRSTGWQRSPRRRSWWWGSWISRT